MMKNINMKPSCPAYQPTQDARVNCFITGGKCNYSDYTNCSEYQFHLHRPHTRDIAEMMRISSIPKRIGNPAMGIVDGLDFIDSGIARDLNKAIGDELMFGGVEW